MIEQLMAMEGYDKDKKYVVAKHSDNHMMIVKGRVLAGEIPDASGDQNGTMQVWEIPGEVSSIYSYVVTPYSHVVDPTKTEPGETGTVTVATPEPRRAAVGDYTPDNDPEVAAALAAFRSVPVVEPLKPKPSHLKRALKKLSKKGTK